MASLITGKVPEMCWLVGVRCTQLGNQNAKDVDEEDKVGQDAGQARCHVDPFDIAIGGWQGPAHFVVIHQPQ